MQPWLRTLAGRRQLSTYDMHLMYDDWAFPKRTSEASQEGGYAQSHDWTNPTTIARADTKKHPDGRYPEWDVDARLSAHAPLPQKHSRMLKAQYHNARIGAKRVSMRMKLMRV